MTRPSPMKSHSLPPISVFALLGLGFVILAAAVTPPALGHESHPDNPSSPSTTHDSERPGCTPSPISALTPFLDALPLPKTAVPARYTNQFCVPVAPNLCFSNALPVYQMRMLSFQHQFHQLLPPVEVWGYEGQYPGPTIEAEIDQPILVEWINQLPKEYPDWLKPNTSLHGVDGNKVRTVVHLHGAASLPRYDGYPTNTFGSGELDTYFYTNIDFNGDGETHWYHDHAIGLTAQNVYAGLAGFYFLRNPALETKLNLPSGKYEVPLVLQDRDIQVNCPPATLAYNQLPPWHTQAVVNGKITPYLEVEPTQYRFRILNGAAFRTFGLNLQITDATGSPTSTNSPPNYIVIGNESGYLPAPVAVNSTPNNPGIRMMPGERIDLVIDFTAFAGANLTLVNNLIVGDVPFAPYIHNVMQFRVKNPSSSTPLDAPIPKTLVTRWVSTETMVAQAVRTRQITLDFQDEGIGLYAGPPFNRDPNAPGYFALINLSPFEYPITDFPVAGDTEIWEIVNLTNESHPLHIHLLDFRIINRQRFAGSWSPQSGSAPTNVFAYVADRMAGTLKPLNAYLDPNLKNIKTPQPFESGSKDVAHAAPFSVTRIVMTWPTNEIFYATPSAISGDPATHGRYAYHCHILDHEDNDMMRPIQVRPTTPGLETVYRPSLKIDGQSFPPSSLNHYSLLVRTRANTQYNIEWSPSVVSPDWRPAKSIAGTGEAFLLNWPNLPHPNAYYRLSPR